jgi:hypothetical protein
METFFKVHTVTGEEMDMVVLHVETKDTNNVISAEQNLGLFNHWGIPIPFKTIPANTHSLLGLL